MRKFALYWRRAFMLVLTIACMLDSHAVDAQIAPNKTDDILWDMGSLKPLAWTMNAGVVLSENYIGTAMPTDWTIAAVGDFSGTGRTDILWTATNGAPVLWINQGNGQVNAVPIAGSAPTSSKAWTGDFYGDGHSDILWDNGNSTPVAWRMNGASIVSTNYIGTPMPMGWHIAGVGDFSGNGLADIIWTGPNGASVVWMNQGNGRMVATSLVRYGMTPGKAWVADFNGDGKDDILWDMGTARPVLWTMNGASVVSGSYLGLAMPQGWHIAGVGDFTGNGLADILWSDGNGSTVVWLNQGNGQVSAVSLVKYGNVAGEAWIGHFHIDSSALNIAPTLLISPPIIGSCGTANGTISVSVPTMNLCTAGLATKVSGNGPWTWYCVGANGGETAQCSAPVQTSASPVTSWVTFSSPPSATTTAPIVTMESVPGGADATPVLAAAIARAKALTAGTLVIPQGTYTFKTLDSSSPGNAAHIVLQGLSNMTIQGNGSTFIFTNNAQGIYIAGSQGVQLQNFTIEFKIGTVSQ